MTKDSSYAERHNKMAGDVAVDGLLAGLLAGVVMGVFLVLADWLAGISPADTLSRFDPAAEGSPLVGGLLHLALSGLYGVAFALLFRVLLKRWPAVGRWAWLVGVGYGLVLWLGAQTVLVTGISEELGNVPALLFALAHVLYGAVLGLMLARLERNAVIE
jgi:hypothetical protein